jgi:hypothetical protein
MIQQTSLSWAALYETDETAWLEATAELARTGRMDQIDPGILAEYLTDMAKRDRREVFSRLVVLLAHLLKWQYQPEGRSRSWQGTILEQQQELRPFLESGTLRNHALAVLGDAYTQACQRAAVETGLSRSTFPEACPWDLEAALADQSPEA